MYAVSTIIAGVGKLIQRKMIFKLIIFIFVGLPIIFIGLIYSGSFYYMHRCKIDQPKLASANQSSSIKFSKAEVSALAIFQQ